MSTCIMFRVGLLVKYMYMYNYSCKMSILIIKFAMQQKRVYDSDLATHRKTMYLLYVSGLPQSIKLHFE